MTLDVSGVYLAAYGIGLVVDYAIPYIIATAGNSGYNLKEASEKGGSQLKEAFHHTTSEYAELISRNGLRPGSYATQTKGLSPLQAHIELALNPIGGARNAVLQVDVASLRTAGYEIPQATRVIGQFGMAGGGWEMKFPYSIPPEFIEVIIP